MYRGTDSDSDGESGTAATVSEQSLSSSRAASPSESIQSVQSVNEAFLESLLLNMRDAAGAAALRLGLVSSGSGSGSSASNAYPSTAQAPATPSNRLFDIRGGLNDATPSLGIGHLLSQHHNHHHNHEHQQPSSKTVKLLGGRKRRTSTIDSMHNFEQDWQDRNEDNDNFRNSPHFESPEKMPQKDFLDLDFRDSKKLASMSSLFDADAEDRVDSDDLDELKLHASLPPSLAAWDSTPFVFGGTGLPSTFQNTHQQQIQHPFQHNPFHNQQNHQQMHHNQHQVFQSFQSSSLFQHPQASLSLPSASLFGATAPQQSFTPFSFDFANHSHQQQNNKHEQEQAAAKNLDIDSLFHQLLPPNQEQSSASLFDIRNTTHRTSPSIKRKTRNQTSSSSSTASATQPQHLPQRRASDAFLGIQNATASKSGRYPTRTKTTSGSSSSSSLDQMMEEDEQEDLAGSKTPFFSASSMPPIMANNAVDLNPFLDIGGIDEYLLGTAGAVGNVPGHGMNPFLIESGGGIGMMDLMNGTASDMMELETMFDPNLFGLAAPSQLLEDSMGEDVIKQEPVSIPTTATATATKASTKKYSRKRPTSSREMSATPKPEDFGHPSDEELPAIGPSTTARSKKTSTAVPGTVNRRAVKEYVNCMTCNAQLGVLELRGTVVGIAYQPQLQCTTCAPPSTPPPTSDPSTSDPAPKPRRKRTSTTKDASQPHQKTHPAFPCLVCKTLKAHGHIINPQDPTTPTPVTATLVCPTCDTKYLFCAECGGGGKQRTGKYRPRALFPSTRKTCSLPHIRIGTAQVHTRVVAPPFGGGGGVGKGVLEGMKDVLFDCWVGALAVPGVLDGDGGDGGVLGAGGGFGGVEDVLRDVEGVWDVSCLDVVRRGGSGGGRGKVFVTVAWIEKVYRMKSKSSANGGGGGVGKKKVDEGVASGSGGGVWMNKMTEVESGIVKPIDVGDVKLEGGGEDDGGVEKTYVSFAVTEWDRRNGTLFIHQISPRSAYQPTADSYRDLLKATIRHIQSDAEYRQFPPLKHIWCWTRTTFHSRLRGIPERMGFIPLNEYLAKERLANETGRALFDSDGKEVLRDDGAVVFGCRVDTVLK